jgi:hypothetical protein
VEGNVTLNTIAETYRVRIRSDECGDPIIPGKRGHMYVDAGKVCIMLLDAKPILRPTLQELGGKVWQGDKSPNAKGIIVQDAKVVGILPNKIGRALQIARVPKRRYLSPERREKLAASNKPFRFRRGTVPGAPHCQQEARAGGPVIPGGHPGSGDAK